MYFSVSFSKMAGQQEIAKTDSSKQLEKLPTTSYWCQMKGRPTLREIDFKWTIERLAFLINYVGVWEPLTSTKFGQSRFKA